MKNTKIKYIFIRHSKLDLPYKDHSEMPLSVITDLGTKKLNPGIDINFLKNKFEVLSTQLPFENVSRIVVSPSQRCIETGNSMAEMVDQKTKNHIPIFQEQYLVEVHFNVLKIIKDLNTKPSLAELNNLIFQAMTGLREGSELIDSVLNRMNKVINKFKKSDGITLFVTHSFMLEALQMHILNKNTSNKNEQYETLLKVPRIQYASGFTTDSDLNIIDFI